MPHASLLLDQISSTRISRLVKDFALHREGMGLNFRAEFFNLFNHPEFGSPVNDINSPGFGGVNSTVNNPRLIQLALKLTF